MTRSASHQLLGALVVTAALVSVGCTTSEPSEQVHYLVACGGGRTGLPNICYAKAEELCPGGYTILSSGGEVSASDPQSMRIACRPHNAKP